MKNITIGIDYSQIRREVYAESACVALMTGGNRPQIITEDNENLVNLYIDTAVVETVGSLVGFVGKGIDFTGPPVCEIPFTVPEDIHTGIFRRQIEQSVIAKTLELLYEGNANLSKEYKLRFRRIIAIAKQILATPE